MPVELDLALIRKKSVAGVLALTSRTFLLQLINFGAMFLLTIFLSPAVFGVFFIVTAAVNFLNYFADIGLAAALIQKKERLTRTDLKTTFTIQQILVIALVLLALLFSGMVANFYGLSPDGLRLLQVLIVAFFLASLKTIPSILLERRLDFHRLVVPQIAETIAFNFIAVGLAWQGFGLASFTWAVLARGVVGLVLIYWLSPWRPGLALDRSTAKKLLSFGIPFQANSLLALVKDDLLTVFLGKVLPFSQVGFIGWAQKWANMPLRFIMDSVTKVTFPTYSRVQDNLTALKAGIEKALFAVCLLTFPALVGMALLAAPLVQLLPRYLKWQPALLSLYFFAAQAALACISTTLTNSLNATGRIKTTLKLMIFWTSLTWLLTPLLIWLIGYHGVALAALLVAASVFIPVRLVKKMVDFSLTENVGKPMFAALLMGVVIAWLKPWLSGSLTNLFCLTLLGAIIYFSLVLMLAKKSLTEAMSLVRQSLKK